ncbi:MAG: hypothetical protein PHI06_14875 [Desulfobulbaceae bacterium]|nr:hypothetical protein [Desulfobulbaceae bacterium]
MAEELGKIEKPAAADYKKGRKLYFVPLIYGAQESPAEYVKKFDQYWKQVEDQIGDLELKLGKVSRIYHELIPSGGEEGLKALKDLNEKSHEAVQSRVKKGAQLEATEDAELLTEFMDWSRCLAMGLQNPKVFNTVYEAYTDAGKKRNEFISKHIDETLKTDEIGILFMKEGHQVQFPPEIEVFYVAPPMLDEINRWLRDREAQLTQERKNKAAKKESK